MFTQNKILLRKRPDFFRKENFFQPFKGMFQFCFLFRGVIKQKCGQGTVMRAPEQGIMQTGAQRTFRGNSCKVCAGVIPEQQRVVVIDGKRRKPA